MNLRTFLRCLAPACAALLASCKDVVRPDATGSIALHVIVPGAPAAGGPARSPAQPAGHLTSATATATSGTTTKTITLTGGTGTANFTGTITGLAPGTYTVTVQGFVGTEVDYFGQTAGVTVSSGQTATANVTFKSFVPTLNAFSPAQTTLMKLVATFSAVEADSYVVELDRTAQFPSPTRTTVATTTAELSVSDSGAFYVRVRAKSAQVQQTGRASSAQSVRVIRDGNEPNNSSSSAVALGFAPANSTTSAQNILPASDADWFYLGACQGDNVTAETRAARLTPSSPLNTRLDLYNEAGTVVASNDDGSGTGTDSRLQLTITASGFYAVQVRGVGTSVGHYDLLVQVTRGAINTGSTCTQFPPTFGGTMSRTSAGFADTMVVKPHKLLPWDGDEVVTVAGAAAWIVSQGSDSIVFLVPNAPVAQDTLRISKQGTSPQNITQDTLLNVTSRFTQKNDTTGATNIANGPFPQTFFVSLQDTTSTHLLKLSRNLPLGLTVTLEWQDPVDLDVSWVNYKPALRFTGNLSGFTTGTGTRSERSTVGVPGRETWYLTLSTRDTTGAPEQMAKVTIAEAAVYASLTVGFEHTCGIVSGGKAYCWGQNDSAQIGDGTTSDRSTPVAVGGGQLFTEISTGWYHTCGVTSTDAVYCWGSNLYGQLGDATTTSRSQPTKISGTGTFTSVSAGWGHTCGVATSGQVYCWGSNFSGELGVSFASQICSGVQCSTTPVAISSTLPFVSLTASDKHTCGVRPTAFLYCWGYNFYGQLGDGTTTSRSSPSQVGSPFRQVGAFLFHTCATTTGGAGYCWGNNRDGQLATGGTDTLPNASPLIIAGDWAQIVGGRFHSCGVTELFADLTTFGSPKCWGSNFNGKLGDGTTTSRTSPTAVSGSLVSQVIRPGSQHTCTLTATALAYCWGLNSVGQLGNGSTTSSTTPVVVSGQPAPAPIAAAGDAERLRRALPAVLRIRSDLSPGTWEAAPWTALPQGIEASGQLGEPFVGPEPRSAEYRTLLGRENDQRASERDAQGTRRPRR